MKKWMIMCAALCMVILGGCSDKNSADPSGELTIATIVEGNEIHTQEVGTQAGEVQVQTVAPQNYETYSVEVFGQDVTPAGSDMRETVNTGENTETVSEQPETPAQETVMPADPLAGSLVNSGLFDLTGLSNESVPYGNDWDDKAANGLPQGVFWYESVYGAYHPVYYIKTEQPILYLTFDEGYEAGYTPMILDTLRDRGVHAVFFITRQFFDSSQDLIQRMINEGHIIGNHSCAHPAGGFPKYVDANGIDAFVNDLSTLHKLVYDTFGYSMNLFRFPEGESSPLTLAMCNNLGYTPVFWSYAHYDFNQDAQPDPAVTLDRCLSHMGNGAVYLLHAVSSSNTAALGAFIDNARAQGFQFGDFPIAEVTAR